METVDILIAIIFFVIIVWDIWAYGCVPMHYREQAGWWRFIPGGGFILRFLFERALEKNNNETKAHND